SIDPFPAACHFASRATAALTPGVALLAFGRSRTREGRMRKSQGWVTTLLLPVTAALLWISLGLPERVFTGFVLRGDGVEVVVPGSPAARAGLEPGDRLLDARADAGGAPIAGRLIAGLAAGHPATWTVERHGVRRVVWLVPAHLPRGEFRLIALLFMAACG